MVSQFILDKSKLTPGHVNTLLVIVGCILSGFGFYDKLLDIFHAGASVPIMNFGYLLGILSSRTTKYLVSLSNSDFIISIRLSPRITG